MPPAPATETSPPAASSALVRTSAIPAAEWAGPGARGLGRRSRSFSWRRTIWSLLYPPRRRRIWPTPSGTLLILLSLGVGIAAYSSANNILFITLSLLLSCLVLSGVLSWLNFARVAWRLVVVPPCRVGQSATATIELRNHKRVLPTYGLTFEVRSSSTPNGVRLVWRDRLEPRGGEGSLEWVFCPARRGRETIELTSVGSAYPFAFLRKALSCELRQSVLVWPAPAQYQRFDVLTRARPLGGDTISRLGQSSDLLSLRPYNAGDSHRAIHWKASARLQQLMVRQFASESQETFSLWLETPAALWTRPEQFELLCSFVATLAEDLFTAGSLRTVAINDGPTQPVRRVRELEQFFDQLALLSPLSSAGQPLRAPGAVRRRRRHVLTFAPDGTRGVAAYLDGTKAAAA